MTSLTMETKIAQYLSSISCCIVFEISLVEHSPAYTVNSVRKDSDKNRMKKHLLDQ
jgi:hypothetical protein